jgi:2-polyprenyl-6-methoxyphenol hydroxylase-like FAD-dependent oxidoreductase
MLYRCGAPHAPALSCHQLCVAEAIVDETEVLIAGAGPTGLVLALWLVRQGVKVRIVDRNAGPGTSSRAMAVQARTLELYRQLDLVDEIVAGGLRNPAINMWVKGEKRARLSFRDAGRELTPYPFVLIYPQDRHERVLARRLEEAGVRVERNTELLGFEQDADGVVARLRGPAGDSVCRAAWLAGCDGAHSAVRHQMGTGFEGGTYEHTFYVADVDVSGPSANGEIHLSLEDGDFAALFAYDEHGGARLIGAVRDEVATEGRDLEFDDVRQRAISSLGLTIERVNWFSTYHVHHRVAGHYRSGRALLLGDAAHVHSPAGGQGMNTGIGDAVNLAWKLAHVLRGRAPDSLVDSYEAERKAFARRLVETTDRVFSFVIAEGGFADFVRTRIAPLFASAAYGIDPIRSFMFRVLSQMGIHYPDSPLSAGHAGHVRGGDRLPWTGHGGPDNHEPLSAIVWQVHVYGTVHPALEMWCAGRGLALYRYDWCDACQAAGLARDAAYLVRPDTYVALVDRAADRDTLEAYFTRRGIRPA